MVLDKKIIINKEKLEKSKTKLRGLKLIVNDPEQKYIITEILELLESEIEEEDITLEEKIHKKMVEAKPIDSDVHFNLYMIHRKLQERKITQEEALKLYEVQSERMAKLQIIKE